MKIFSIAFILTLTSIINIQIQAQAPGGPCASDIRLSSQNDVDNFYTSYGCTQITGTLTVESSTIFNLDSLYILTSVGGLVLQNNPNLPNIDGLAGLTTIGAGGILVYQNAALTNIDGLSQVLISNGPVEVSANDRLKNIDGLNRLTGAVNQVRFIGNDSLTNLDGVSRLRDIDDDSQLVISNNLSLTSIAGLESLFRLEYLEITGNPALTNLAGLESVGNVGTLSISSNNALVDINGLSGLTVVRPNDPDVSTLIDIHHNDALQNIDGLRQVTTVGQPSTPTTITISFNPSLTNVDGLSSMGLISGFTKRLNVLSNTSLTDYCGLYNMIKVTTASGACPQCITTDFSNNAVAFDAHDILFNCIPDEEKCHDVSLSTQEAVDAFPQLRGCTVITGTLTIGGSLITHLDSLRGITSAQALEINSTGRLNSLHGLEGLTEVGSMDIAFNDSLKNLEGLDNLSQVNGFVNIHGNTRLERLDGLDNLALVTGPFDIESNFTLERLDGLEGLTRVDGNFSIAANQGLRTLHGLSGLESVGGSVSITQNTVLQSLDGLNNLSAIGGYLQIRRNTWLDNLDALVELDSIGSSSNLSVVIRDNERLEWCCGLFKALTEGPLQGQVIMQDNRESCTQAAIVENGPCCPPGSELPLDKVFFAENTWGIAPFGTNIFIQDEQLTVQYILRNVDGNIPVAGPQGSVGPMFINGIDEDTEYNMLARDMVTGCTAEMTTTILIHAFVYPSTCANPPLDKQVIVEQDSGAPGMATNVIVLNGEEGVVYALRKNGLDAWVNGPYPASAGLYTGAVNETTTFNVLAIDEDTHCSIQMTDEVTITIDAFGQVARMAADDTGGNEKARLRGLSVSPNPSNGEFDVEIPDKGSYQIQVRDMTGRSVATSEILRSEGLAKVRMGLTDKPAGMYILTIYSDKGIVATRKVVIRQ